VILLALFALVAGAATALSPCVLPVLPVVLAAGATSGRRRPLGIVTGLVLAFTFATVALVYLLDALGLPDDLFRVLAIAVLALAGLTLVVPPLGARVEAALGRVAHRAPAAGGDGFAGGLVLGASLGLLYAPCAGPILAGVITVSAAQPFAAGRLVIAFAYGAGAAAVLYALMLGGRRLMRPLARRSGAFQRATGVVLVVVAAAMAANLDVRFQNSIATALPAVLVNPSKALEESASAQTRLADLRDGRDGVAAAAEGAGGGRLPDYGAAPAIRGTQRWFNTPGGSPLTLAGLRGRVVLIDFWTYSCINCIRTLPALKAWDRTYRDAGLTIIGVHAPEFPFERDAGNVADAIARNGLRYPVVQDNDFATWRAYDNQFWPAKYLIDARGRVRYAHFGEGEYDTTERAIRALLTEAGDDAPAERAHPRVTRAAADITPETYLGADRAASYVNRIVEPGLTRFRGARVPVPLNHLAYDGLWRITGSSATAAAGGELIRLRFRARRVFLVLGARAGASTVRVKLDGRPHGTVHVTQHRLYEMVSLPRAGQHMLELEFDRGVEAYAFTFG
jgi:cytochrome c biogenesis protein CcdA/thiol-disulfide isomerase/thioredoxin